MQANISSNGRGDSDNDSLFGSPPSSPVRGRSPALALPSGECCTQNVGTIALPGSQHFIELPVNTPALSLSGFSHHELSQRPPALNQLQMQYRPQVELQTQAQPSQSGSSKSMRGGRKKKSSRENSSAPRPPPPPIHLPDPDAPPPPNFLRNQQALLGLAGLIGGVHPANLSVPRHTRGSNASNPIVVEDTLNPPPLGCQNQPSAVDSTKLSPPSNEEIVASLIREKNIFPVLESILKLIAGNVGPTAQKGHDSADGIQGPASKRRKIDGVPAGAADWDVPFPFVDMHGNPANSANWEKERGKQLIAQLVALIKSAARKAATRTHHQQHVQPRRHQQPARQQQQHQPVKQQESEPKIMGHYRPITATYGRLGAQIPEVLADQSNTSGSSAQTSPSPPYEPPPAIQAFQSSPSDTESQLLTPFDDIISSLLAGSPAPSSVSWDDGKSTSGWSGGTHTPSETSQSEFDQKAFDNWMSILNAFPDPIANGTGPSTSPDYYVASLLSSTSNDSPTPYDPLLTTHNNSPSVGGSTPSPTNTNPDFAIDPVLLAMSMPNGTQRDFDAMSALASPIESPITNPELLNLHVDRHSSEPDRHAREQGTSIETAQNLFVAQMVANQDPMAAASTLLQFASSSSNTTSLPVSVPAPSAVELTPAIGFGGIQQTAPRPPYNFFQQPASHTDQSKTPAERPTTSAPKRTSQTIPASLRPIPTANKQDILARARERRRQLVGEIDRAKVELWETTIEQGVLAQLVKEKL